MQDFPNFSLPGGYVVWCLLTFFSRSLILQCNADVYFAVPCARCNGVVVVVEEAMVMDSIDGRMVRVSSDLVSHLKYRSVVFLK
jgi:hypothetical protein